MSKRPAYQDWKKVKFRKQENKVRGEHDFSIRLEATLKDSVQTGKTPRQKAPIPPRYKSLQRAHKPVGDQKPQNAVSNLLRVICLTPGGAGVSTILPSRSEGRSSVGWFARGSCDVGSSDV